MKKLYCILLFLFFVLNYSYSQVEMRYIQKGDQIDGYQKSKTFNKCIKQMPTFDVDKLTKEDAEKECITGPLRFGKEFDVSYTLDDGQWEKVKGGRLWTITIKSKGAYSLNFVFNNFYLADGAKLFMENEDGTMLYGPVTSDVLSDDGFFLTDIIAGDCVTISLFEPNNVRSQSSLTIERVVHGYKNIFGLARRTTREDTTSPNVVNYPEYEMESDAVGLILSPSGTKVGSGSLIISADSKFEPYFMTDYRLADDDDNGQITSQEKTWTEKCMFKFRHKLDANGNPVTSYTYNKCDICAGWSTSCFLLVRIRGNLKENTNLAWLGWDKTTYLPSSGTVIHHPYEYSSYSYMKVSLSNTQFQTPGSVLLSNMKTQLSVGTVDWMSCGAPLLDGSSKRVVGMFYGRYSALSWIDFTRFSMSWTGGGTSSTRLKDWLDPENSGTTYTYSNRAMEIIGTSVITSPSTYYVNHLPTGYTVEWHITDIYYDWNCLSQSGNQCTITPTPAHSLSGASLTAHVKQSGVTVCILSFDISTGYSFTRASSDEQTGNTSCAFPKTHTLSIEVSNGMMDVSIIPNSEYDEGVLDTPCDREIDEVSIWKLEVFNAATSKKIFSKNVSGALYTIETSGWKSGIYVIRATLGDEVLSEKVVKK